jgi:hypothetical protein
MRYQYILAALLFGSSLKKVLHLAPVFVMMEERR